MANNYDYFSSSSTYGKDDMDGGGEQIDSALYLNEAAAKAIEERLEKKQSTIILQPNAQPPDPNVTNMWIDNSVFPNIIYAWNEVTAQWEKVVATSAEEVGSYTKAQVDNIANTTKADLSSIESRTTIIEGFMKDGDALTAKVIDTTKYKDNVKTIADGQIQSAINDLNMAQYMTSAQFGIEKDKIFTAFSKGNGLNLLKNSVGYGYNADGTFPSWQVTAGTVSTIQGSDMIESGSGFFIKDGVIKQVVTGIVGEEYTLTVKVNKGTAGSAYIKLSDGQNFQQVDFIATAAYNYTTAQIKGFIPQTGAVIVEFGATGATGGATFTAAMLNLGAIGQQWSFAMGEMYNGNTKFDINGVEVRSSVYDGYTRMSPQEFAGYARNKQGTMEKIFTLNGETTETKQNKITEYASIGTIKILRVDGGGKRGIAFIPNS